jgi:hypothetical protein
MRRPAMAKKKKEPLEPRGFGFDITPDHLARINPTEIKHGQIWVGDGLKAHVIVDPARVPYLNIGNSGLFMVPLKAKTLELASVPQGLRREFLYAGTMDIIVPIGATPRRSA